MQFLGAAIAIAAALVESPCALVARLRYRTTAWARMGYPTPEEDFERAVANLRRSYYRVDDAEDTGSAFGMAQYNHHSRLHAERAALLGMYASIPVVYSSHPLLPQSQTVIDAWQRPDFDPALEPFILMFETLLRGAPPWEYAHVCTMGPGRARATGTLMRIVNTKRTADGRLQLLVQGVGVLRILEEASAAPFPRVHAQLTVDAEALLRADGHVARRTPPTSATAPVTGRQCADDDDGTTQYDGASEGARSVARLRLASALASERAWWAYEAAGFDDGDGRMPGTLVAFDRSACVRAVRVAAEARASRALCEARGAWSEAGAAAAAEDNAYSWTDAGADWFLEVPASDAAEAALERRRCALVARLEGMAVAAHAEMDQIAHIGDERAEELERAIWIELDDLLRRYAARGAREAPTANEVPTDRAARDDGRDATDGAPPHSPPRLPAELLGLLPPSLLARDGARDTRRDGMRDRRALRWPRGCTLPRMAELADPLGEHRVDPRYPAWRRTRRLSFALDSVLAQLPNAAGDHQHARRAQALLEAPSTTARLRIALRIIRDARQALTSSA